MNRRDFLKSGAVTTAAAAVAYAPSFPQHEPQDRGIVRYPDPWVIVIDERFRKMVNENAAVERLYTGTRWGEGPVWFGDGRYLLWSDIPNNRILRWVEDSGQVSIFRSPSNNSNGNTRDVQGRLITCERRQVTRTELDGKITVLMDRFQGQKLNSPNDIAVHPDGHIWFTDPGYGIMTWYEGEHEPFELPTCTYRLDPATGQATVADEEIEKPNGICFSPDFKKLYVVDTADKPGQPHNIHVFDVVEWSRLANRRVFYNMGPGGGDGIRCDREGNLWPGAGWGAEKDDGVRVIAPDGKLIGKIHLPEACANLCFGGAKKNRLFMTASQSLYALYVEAQGAQVP
jgi:gluconolactonase